MNHEDLMAPTMAHDEVWVINVADVQYHCAEEAVRLTNHRFTRLHQAGRMPVVPPLPSLEGVILTIPISEEVVECLVGNLERLAEAALSNEDDNSAQPALLLARKIRAVTGMKGPSF